MSKQEMLMLSTKDRDRLKILHEVKRKHLTQRAAAQQLGVSDRWVRELLRRVKKEGDRGVVHRGRGRVSNRRLPESVRTKTLKLVQAKYRDFGPTLACEYLAKNHQVEVSKETLRQWLILEPRHYKAYDSLGLCYEAMGKTAGAYAAFTKAQRIARDVDPTYDWPYADLAEMLIKQDRAEEALPQAEEALRINPRSARDNYLVGRAMARRDNPRA